MSRQERSFAPFHFVGQHCNPLLAKNFVTGGQDPISQQAKPYPVQRDAVWCPHARVIGNPEALIDERPAQKLEVLFSSCSAC